MRDELEKRVKENVVLFIKSSSDINKVANLARQMAHQCIHKEIKINFWFWDTSEDTDINRPVMRKFFDEVEEKNIGTIVVRTLKDISGSEIEREAFLETMLQHGIGIYLYDEGCFATIEC